MSFPPLKYVLIVLLFAGPVWAQESDAGIEEATAGEIGEIFRTVGSEIEAPKPETKPQLEVQSEAPQGGRRLSVLAYSYCLRGRTASGRYTEHGIVAVDPRVIPLGSKLYIPGYGWAVAADTGGAIIGNKIDVWLPSAAQCYQWGVRRLNIQVFPR